MVDRIQKLIRIKKLTPSQFADEIGIQRSGMSHIISGRNNPSLEFVMKVLKRYPEIKPEWLLYGTGVADNNINPVESREPEIKQEPVQENEKVINPGPSATLFDEMEAIGGKAETKPLRNLKKDKAGRKIEKIVVFYDDRTFREYDPE